MDHKTWRWRKRSSEKTIVANDIPDLSSKGNEQVMMIMTEKEVDLERSVKDLNEKLASILRESDAKDDLVAQHVQTAKEATEGRDKAEAEVASLKQELNEVSQQRVESNERLIQLNAALKESMLQSNSFREEHEQRIRDAEMRTSREFEKSQRKLEEKYTETSKRLTSLTVENTQLSKGLLVKEKLIEDLRRRKSHAEAEFGTLMARLDSIEKENAFLKYEFHMLEKELDIRNEEREFNHQYVNASHKEQLENEKKISKLEAECQRLRILIRKRGGPNALTKMKSEEEIQGKNQMEMRRKKMNPVNGGLVVRDATIENLPEFPKKRIDFLIERLCNVEEENKILKEFLAKKDDELQSSRLICAQTGLRLPGSDLGNSDKICCSRSWASSVTSELELKSIGVSDMSLMDDFVEMEKLAIVSVDSPFSADANHASTGKELVPVVQVCSGDSTIGESLDWLQRVLEVILDQNRVSKRSLNELLEDIRLALTSTSSSSAFPVTKSDSSVSDPLPISGYITWKSPNLSPRTNTLDGVSSADKPVANTNNEHNLPDLSGSICKIIKLIEEIYPSFSNPEDYYVRVFRWGCRELSSALQHFVHTCNDLLNGKSSFENFSGELASALDWVIKNCITTQEFPSVTRKKHFGGDGSQIESDPCEDKSSFSPLELSLSNNLQEENRKLKNEVKIMESSRKDLEARLKLANDTNKALINQLEVSEQSIGSLKAELETLRASKGMIEDQIENEKSLNEDLDTQLNVSRVKLNELLQKLLSLQVELEDRSHCCEELEAICLELQLQLESVTDKNTPKDNTSQEEKPLETGWEITAASAKLEECQETILNLGKQLKALTLPKEVAILDKVLSTTTTAANDRKLGPRPSLRERMLADDNVRANNEKSPNTVESTSTAETKAVPNLPSKTCDTVCARNVFVATPEVHIGLKHVARAAAVGAALAIVPSKKRGGGGGGFLRKLLMKRKKGSCKKASLFIA